MKLAIPPELETMIQQVIERGQYDDPLEAIAAGLTSWHNDHARLSEWWDGLGPNGQREFAESIDDAASGSFVDLEPGYFDSLRARARAKAMGRETALVPNSVCPLYHAAPLGLTAPAGALA